MSEFRIWLSILSWATTSVAAAIGAHWLALKIDPSLSYLALMLIVMLAVQAVYFIRKIARRLGWVRPSYAPRTDH